MDRADHCAPVSPCHALTLIVLCIGVNRCDLPMLPMLEIKLEWPVASQYVVRQVPPTSEPAIRPAKDATISLKRPLEENPNLYADFARLDGTKKACLDFAHKYGTLFYPVSGIAYERPVLESFTNWRRQIKNIRDVIRRCDLSRSNPADAFFQFGKNDKRLFGVELFLSIKSSNSPATLEMHAGTLIAGMQLQAVQSILLEGRKSVQCIECSGPFEIGRGARRSQSKFCSTGCKDDYHNRLKAQGRRNDHA